MSAPLNPKPISIGINLTWLVPGVVGGSEEYTLRLLFALTSLAAPKFKFKLFCRHDLIRAYPELLEAYEVIRTPWDFKSRASRVMAEQLWLAKVSADMDFMHHAGGIVPLVRSQPGLVTVHDLQPLELPQNFGKIKVNWLKKMLPYSVRAARLVLCPSRFTAECIIKHFGTPWSKLRIVPHGYERPKSLETERPLKARYLLYPAIAYEHKRHQDILAALERLDSEHDDVKIVYTGSPGPRSEYLSAEVARRGLGERVEVLGRVSEQELGVLYQHAEALVFPSSYEGFGNPCLEAMSRGCPVVAAAAGALPEVLGNAGLMYQTADTVGLADRLTDLLSNERLRKRLIAQGLERAQYFSLERAGTALLGAYRDGVAAKS